MFDHSLLALLQLTDSTLPIGGYAHSSGLETYVQKGLVKNLTTARDFVTGMLTYSLQYTDAAFVSFAYDAATANDWNRLLLLDEESTAIKLPSEVRQASNRLGMRLLKIFMPVCTQACASTAILIRRYMDAIHSGLASGHYSIAFGVCAATLEIPKPVALSGFYYNATSAMITNCVKLIPLGQQDGQELLFSFHPLIQQLVSNSIEPDPSMVGICCPGFDMRCMQHEQLYSRMYMS